MSYDDLVFSAIYNNKFSDFSVKIAPYLYAYIQTRNKKAENILDLCCGTGQLANYFLRKGYSVCGIDISESMLKYAIKLNSDYIENGQADFLVGDASNFKLDEEFSVVFSTYDALNHLESEEHLKMCFKSVYNVTEENGLFIFDLNTRKGLSRYDGSLSLSNDEKQFNMSQSFYDPSRNKAMTKYSGFVKTKKEPYYLKYEETIYNTIFEMNQVKSLLVKTGWKDIRFTNVSNLQLELDDPENADRVFIIASK